MKKFILLLCCFTWLSVDQVVHAKNNVNPTNGSISYEDRIQKQQHKGGVFWLTGLSGAGKSTIAYAAEKLLFAKGLNVIVLDGDNLRSGLNNDLGFTEKDRKENMRRTLEVAKILEGTGAVVICSLISPYITERQLVKTQAKNGHEIYVKADVETCIQRDPKGLYQKALKGEIKNFTGISSPYEVSQSPDLIVDTEKTNPKEAGEFFAKYIISKI